MHHVLPINAHFGCDQLYSWYWFHAILFLLYIAVIVRFRAAGNAPIMKQSKFKITASESFQTVSDFLRRQLKFNQHDSLVWGYNYLIYLFAIVYLLYIFLSFIIIYEVITSCNSI